MPHFFDETTFLGVSDATKMRIYHVVCGEVQSNFPMKTSETINRRRAFFFLFAVRTKADCVKAIYGASFIENEINPSIRFFRGLPSISSCFQETLSRLELGEHINGFFFSAGRTANINQRHDFNA